MKRTILFLITAALLIAACGGSGAVPDAASADPPVVADEAAVEEAASVDAEVEAAEETVDDATITEEVAQEVADIGPPPAFSADLKATNPDKVVLGNGKPQVVEFFAFW